MSSKQVDAVSNEVYYLELDDNMYEEEKAGLENDELYEGENLEEDDEMDEEEDLKVDNEIYEDDEMDEEDEMISELLEDTDNDLDDLAEMKLDENKEDNETENEINWQQKCEDVLKQNQNRRKRCLTGNEYLAALAQKYARHELQELEIQDEDENAQPLNLNVSLSMHAETKNDVDKDQSTLRQCMMEINNLFQVDALKEYRTTLKFETLIIEKYPLLLLYKTLLFHGVEFEPEFCNYFEKSNIVKKADLLILVPTLAKMCTFLYLEVFGFGYLSGDHHQERFLQRIVDKYFIHQDQVLKSESFFRFSVRIIESLPETTAMKFVEENKGQTTACLLSKELVRSMGKFLISMNGVKSWVIYNDEKMRWEIEDMPYPYTDFTVDWLHYLQTQWNLNRSWRVYRDYDIQNIGYIDCKKIQFTSNLVGTTVVKYANKEVFWSDLFYPLAVQAEEIKQDTIYDMLENDLPKTVIQLVFDYENSDRILSFPYAYEL